MYLSNNNENLTSINNIEQTCIEQYIINFTV